MLNLQPNDKSIIQSIKSTVISSVDTSVINLSEIKVYISISEYLTESVYDSIYTDVQSLLDISPNSYVDNNYISLNSNEILTHYYYIDGKYNVSYMFYLPIIGNDVYESKLFIKEISVSRREILVDLLDKSDKSALNIFNTLSTKYFDQFGPKYKLDKFIGFNVSNFINILNAVNVSNGVILKLYEPIDSTIDKNQKIFFAQLVCDILVDTVDQTPNNFYGYDVNYLKPPKVLGFENEFIKKENEAYAYKNFNDLYPTSSIQKDLFSNRLTTYDLESRELNVDFREFGNFVKFGSAKSMIDNFYNKITKIQTYKALLNLHSNTYIDDNISVSKNNVTSSLLYYTNIINDVFKSFTNYERFLYFEVSQSFTSSLYNKIIDVTYPKSGSSYIDYSWMSYTSSEGVNWYSTMSAIATEYDASNYESFNYIIPEYIRNDERNYQYITFINMVGEFYDKLYLYIKSYDNLHQISNKISENIDISIFTSMLQSTGIKITNNKELVDISRYYYKYYKTGSNLVDIDVVEKNITKEIINRLYINSPYLLKSKGTKNGIRALLNCYGIPKESVLIQEFGGPQFKDTTLPSGNDNIYKTTFDENTYVLHFDGGSYINVPWVTSSFSNKKPESIELKFRTSNLSTMEVFAISSSYGKINVNINYMSSNKGYLSLSILSGSTLLTTTSSIYTLYDNEFNSLHLYRNVSSDNNNINQVYSLHLLKYDYYINKTLISETINLSLTGSLTSSLNSIYASSSACYVGGSPSISNKFVGDMDEFRLWAEKLDDSVHEIHSKFLSSTVGNTLTSSIDTLSFRLPFDVPNNMAVSTSLYNYAFTTQSYAPSASAVNFSSILVYPYNYIYFERSNTIIHGYTIPDFEQQKIRIENSYIPFTFNTSSYDNLNIIKLNALYGDYSINENLPKRHVGEFDGDMSDSNTVLVGFSGIDIINKDILSFFGNNNIYQSYADFDYIYSDVRNAFNIYNDVYWNNTLNNFYLNDYYKFIQMYDQSVFDNIKNMIPERASAVMGAVHEPTILRRTKIKLNSKERVTLTNKNLKYPIIKIDEKNTIQHTTVIPINGNVKPKDHVINSDPIQLTNAGIINNIENTDTLTKINNNITNQINILDDMKCASNVSTHNVNIVNGFGVNIQKNQYVSDFDYKTHKSFTIDMNINYHNINSYPVSGVNRQKKPKKYNLIKNGKLTTVSNISVKSPVQTVKSGEKNLKINYKGVSKFNLTKNIDGTAQETQ